MKIVKLNAIDSTNSYLKDLIKQTTIENWTVIVTDNQIKGKGQFDNSWISEKGKNLTFSILAKFESLKAKQQFYLNYSISIAIYNVLRYYIPEKLSVKWPNDILSANHKICGILIESSINNSNVTHAIIGIGLNVNQEKFPSNILNASSLKIVMNKTIDKDELLDKILLEVQYQLHLIQQQKFKEIKQQYEKILYKKGVPSMFVDVNHNAFLGKIIGVTNEGKLQIELDDESLQVYGLKEIKFKNLS
ncbi:MAG: biotin--[acetyl-CoA-carboxylase] ligase [Flavobacteriaceae bacterium]|nr:biotin--[acetyl-CoA-carboxylase] ligase [Flavobacteriaceae bacterium]